MSRDIRTDYPFMDEIHPEYQQLIKNKKIISQDKVPFICKKHGIYWQRLSAHNNGNGCPKCSHNSNRTDYPFMDKIRSDYQQLIKNGKIKQKDKIPFICKKHGEYWQQLNNHNNGSICPECSKANRTKKTNYE